MLKTPTYPHHPLPSPISKCQRFFKSWILISKNRRKLLALSQYFFSDHGYFFLKPITSLILSVLLCPLLSKPSPSLIFWFCLIRPEGVSNNPYIWPILLSTVGLPLKPGILRWTRTQELDHVIIGKLSYIDKSFLFAGGECIFVYNSAKFENARPIDLRNMRGIRYKTT